MSSPSPRRRATRVAAALLAVGLVGGLALQACGSDSSSSSTTTTAAGADGSTTTTVVKTTSLDDVTVTGDLGSKPTVTFEPSFAGTEESVKLLQAGTGPVVTDGQRVTFDYVAVSGADGSELGTSYGAAVQSVMVGSQDLLPIVSTALTGQTVGSRVLVATNKSSGGGEWVLLVFEIKSAETIPTAASGDAVTPDPALPAVTVDNGVPTIATPTGDAPTQLVVQPLIKGTGPAVTAGQTLTVNYVGLIWASATVFDSSWKRGAPVDFAIGAGQLIPGFDEGLVGQTVGSRVMLVIPPDKGYGAQGNSQAGIAPTDTLVFVIDILAAS
jgi:peptidylprolyl isomerase